MFEKMIKNSQTYKDLKTISDNGSVLIEQQIKELVELTEEIERLKASGAIPIEEGNSSILFEIDEKLNVSTKSRINKDIVNVLIDNKYLDSAQSEDDAAIQLVFVLLANEVTEQIIFEVNDNAE